MGVGGSGRVPPKASIVDRKGRVVDSGVGLEDAVHGGRERASD